MNPLFFNYGMDTTLVPTIAKPSAIIVTGRGNRYDANFQKAQELGATVYAYWNAINIPVGTKNPVDLEQWMGDSTKVPRWRFQGTGPVRVNWPGTELADIRPGSAWRLHFRKISGDLIRSGKFGGFFCDDMGARPWGSNWEEWPVAEQKLWAECMVDIAAELHSLRASIAPAFEIVHNNVWTLPKDHPATAVAAMGDRYCNGVCLENTPPDKKVLESSGKRVRAQFHINYAARTFAGPPFVRRLLSITNHPDMRDQWKADPNVTHFTYLDKAKGQDYMKATPAAVPYKPEGEVEPPPPCEKELAAAFVTIKDLNDRIDAEEHANAALKSKVDELTRANATLQSALDHIHELSAKAPQ